MKEKKSIMDRIAEANKSVTTGIYAAKYVKKVKRKGKLSLEHVKKYADMLKKAGIKPERKAPILLPDYRGKAVLARMIDVFQ